MMVEVAPESWPCVLNPPPIASVARWHAYVIEKTEPTSATCGWHESDAAGAAPALPPGTHCHPVVHLLLVNEVGFQVPVVH